MKSMSYYMVTVLCGHVGSGKTIEITRYFKDCDILSAYNSARTMPRSKKNPTCVKQVKEISMEEYLLGKQLEKTNLYLNTYKHA
ncbi:MAG: hypothetical protein GYA02_03770 [Clostridiaceae bacterium]|nr:hypothetical protein [Clostridiaceae bacterium]